jgi:hypothetical protein
MNSVPPMTRVRMGRILCRADAAGCYLIRNPPRWFDPTPESVSY